MPPWIISEFTADEIGTRLQPIIGPTDLNGPTPFTRYLYYLHGWRQNDGKNTNFLENESSRRKQRGYLQP
jgi:hypothetical protein